MPPSYELLGILARAKPEAGQYPGRRGSIAPRARWAASLQNPTGHTPATVTSAGDAGCGRRRVRQVAGLGYVAIAPNLYHRSGLETAGGLAAGDANRERGFELLGRLTRDGVEADLRAALAYVREHSDATEKTGMLGFSLGGHIAYFAASRLDLAAAAIFYPGWLPVAGTALSRPEPLLEATSGTADHDVRVLMFFAELDHVIDAEQRTQISDALTASGVRHEEVVYPGAQHAFFFPGREPYDKAAADDSWARVSELFATEFGR